MELMKADDGSYLQASLPNLMTPELQLNIYNSISNNTTSPVPSRRFPYPPYKAPTERY